ncbi:glycoside hydrolase family 3 C-terminal domain-containing protein [Actinospica durhamensis]|uniref:Glycoside hydrolase family 3 C-terminal domain-containing protein n=2 Tax=Actinospica durhamensis TaxID=1508375 RepID=A0A941IQY1_9ACTN|nr:glycoside hydrolase family 3 C-terminal domain-containing protein [Actinospica durhamensis]
MSRLSRPRRSRGIQALLAVAAMTGVTALCAPVTSAAGSSPGSPLPIYLNTHYSAEERAADLVSRMTLPEKVAQLSTNSAPAIPRLGVQQYTYWSEGQHGINTLGANQVNGGNGGAVQATSFPTNFASTMSWDPSLVYQETTAISDEARGFLDKSLYGTGQNNLGPSASDFGDLTFWAPTVNMDRDPRWGRTDEAFGEDPYLVSEMAGAFVDGYEGNTMSGQSETGYLKVAATAKHYALNNEEDNRTGISSNVSDTDLRDYYTKQFASLIQNAHVSGLMTSYNAINGTPSVADTYTTNELAQRTYGFNGYITSDCGAIGTTYLNYPGGHDWAPPGWSTDNGGATGTWTDTTTGATVPSQAGGQAYALRAGTDLNCSGGENTLANVEAAIKAGILSESVIDNALVKLFTVRMETGEFDQASQDPYSKITKAQIQSPAHQQLATAVADDSVVLLKNQAPAGSSSALLPLNPKTTNKIVVVGDLAGKVTLGDYSGDPGLQVDAVQGITAELQKANPGAQVVYDACGTSTTTTKAAACSAATLADVKTADAVVVFVGTDLNVATEGTDRTSLAMPGDYDSLISQISAVGNPRTVLAIQSDGPVTIDDVQGDFPSIVFSGYNGETQGTALADVLFGKQNPAGHLDFTWYADDSQLPAMDNYGLTPAETDGLGRTYMYFTGTPTYPFGYGLSYSNFAYSDVHAAPVANANGTVEVGLTVTNTGHTTGSTVAQLYASAQFQQSGATFPKEQLVGFQKTGNLRPGQSQHVTLAVPVSSLEIWDATTSKDVVYDGSYGFGVGGDSADLSQAADVKISGSIKPQVQTVTVQPDQTELQVGQNLDLTGKNPWIADDTTGVGSVPQGRDMSVTADGIVEAANNDGSFADLSASHVSYRSSDPRVASVNSKGLVTAVGDGAADITVTVNGVSGSTPITVGHAVAVSAPALLAPGQNSTVTTTFTNTAATGGAAVRDVAMNLDLPTGWSATATTAAQFASVPAGQEVTTSWAVSVPTGAAGTFTLDADATAGGQHDSTNYTQTDVPYSSLTAAFNNSAITSDGNRGCANLDGAGASYSQQALASVGVTPGTALVHDGLTFTWPSGGACDADNVVAAGQTIDVSGSGSTLGFLGTSAWGAISGTGTVTYTDGTTQPFTIGFGDWANGTPPTGDDIAIRAPYGNQPGNQTSWQTTIEYAPVQLDPSKTVQSITLPPGNPQPSGGIPSMHIFAMSIKSDNLSISAPPTVDAGGSGNVTTTLANPSSAALANVALALNLPSGWTATNTSPDTFGSVAAGATVATSWTVTAPSTQQPGPQVIGVTETVGGTQAGLSGAATQVPYSSLAAGFNNVSITDDSDHSPTGFDGGLDGGGNSFSAEALAAAGLTPGTDFTFDGVVFTWPNSAAGTPDNIEADGRAFDVTGTGSTLGFLGAAANGASSGTVTVTYTDGTTQQFTIGFGDWASTTPYAGGQVAVTSAYGNTSSGTSPWKASVFYDSVTLPAGKTVQSVSLPTAGSAPLHVFAAAVGD